MASTPGGLISVCYAPRNARAGGVDSASLREIGAGLRFAKFAGARLSLRSGASRLRSGTAERRRISLRSAQIQFRSVPLRQHPPGQPFRSTSIPPSLRFSPNQRLRPKGRFPTKRPGLRPNGPVRLLRGAKRPGLPNDHFLCVSALVRCENGGFGLFWYSLDSF